MPVNKNYLVPVMQAVFSRIIAVKHFAIRIFSCCPVFSNSLIVHCQVFSSRHCLWPSGMPYLRPLPSSPIYPLPCYNKSRLCFVTQRTSSVKPCWPFHPYCCWLLTPFNKALLPKGKFLWLFPSLSDIFIHSHFKLPYIKFKPRFW